MPRFSDYNDTDEKIFVLKLLSLYDLSKKRNNLFSIARLVCIFAIALFLCFTTGCTSEQFIGALGDAVKFVIDSLHDAIAWLDFQRTPEEVQELYEKDRVGMTKAYYLEQIRWLIAKSIYLEEVI